MITRPKGATLIQHLVDKGPQRRETHAACGEEDILAPHRTDGETTAERATHANDVAWLQPMQRVGHVADAPNAELESALGATWG
jgi:hypothetical protein